MRRKDAANVGDMEVKSLVFNNSQKRLPYFDFIRGVAIIMVVAIHTFSQCYTTDALSIVGVVLRNIMNCAVPLFCACSAFFLINEDLENDRYKKFLIRRICRVYIPCLFCGLPYFLRDVFSGELFWKALVKYLTCSYGVFYFVAVIIQFYVLLPLFQRIKLLRNRWFGFGISFIWVACYVYVVSTRTTVPLILYAGVILCWWVYFAIGASCGMKGEVNSRNKIVIIVLCVLSLVLSVMESYFRMDVTGSLTGMGIKPSSLLFSCSVCLLVYGKKSRVLTSNNFVTRIIISLGRYSFGIYLVHLLLLSVFNKVASIYSSTNIKILGIYQGGCIVIFKF